MWVLSKHSRQMALEQSRLQSAILHRTTTEHTRTNKTTIACKQGTRSD